MFRALRSLSHTARPPHYTNAQDAAEGRLATPRVWSVRGTPPDRERHPPQTNSASAAYGCSHQTGTLVLARKHLSQVHCFHPLHLASSHLYGWEVQPSFAGSGRLAEAATLK